jgi:hypothetical protein
VGTVGQAPSDSFRWATVTLSSAGAVRVRLDGDTSFIDVQPDLLIPRPAAGERVWVQQHGRRLIIIGKAHRP